MEESFKPVSSAFYEALEELAVLYKPCTVKFWQEGGKAVVHGKIDKVFQSDETGFIRMDSGLNIRLDKVIEVNRQSPYDVS